MLTQEQVVEIRVMARRGESVREIARQLECSRNTVRRYLRDQSAQRYGPREARVCKLDAYKAYLREKFSLARSLCCQAQAKIALFHMSDCKQVSDRVMQSFLREVLNKAISSWSRSATKISAPHTA